ncbi:hypothetical protein [Psychrobacter sanguinis]|uniref:hypothetical protein n=1 Tax=Psychrobacter sanguinis TaxID=861445 RepID=UPI00289EC960|nr:hypothetical protein [Psychrobacter sanguinis]
MTSGNRILVIWSGEVNDVSVGSNYIRSYLTTLNYDSVDFFDISTSSSLLPNKLKRLYSLPITSNILLNRWLKTHCIDTLNSIVRLIKSNKITSIWFFANSMESIAIGSELINCLNLNTIKFNTFVWDSIDYLKNSRRISNQIQKEIDSSYNKILYSSHNIACISQGMKNNLIERLKYKQKTELKKLIVLPFPIEAYSPTIHKPVADNKINIVFVGSTYSWKEWNIFIRTLDKLNWTVNDKTVNFHVYGRPNIRSRLYEFREHIIYHSPLPHNQLISEISKFDYGYLPYYYDKNKKEVVTTSLPGKLSTYIQAQLPIIFHGPRYASAALLIQKYSIGVVVKDRRSIYIEELIKKLESIKVENFNNCFSDFYNIDNYSNDLKRLL